MAQGQGMPVTAWHLDGTVAGHFKSQTQASKELDVDRNHIRDVLRGTRRTAGGYLFTKQGEVFYPIITICVTNVATDTSQEYDSIRDAVSGLRDRGIYIGRKQVFYALRTDKVVCGFTFQKVDKANGA